MADARLAQLLTNSDAVRVGVLDFEIATYNSASLVAYNTDAAFERIGTLVPGSYKPDLGREEFDLMRGLPKTAIKSFVIGQEGKMSLELDEYTARAIEIVNGGQAMIRTTSGATTVSAAPAPTTTVFTVASIGSIVAGKWIAVTIASLGKTFDRKVLSVAGSAITLQDPLPAAPASTDAVALVTSWQNPGGGTSKTYYTARGVFTDTYGDKSYLYFPKVASTGKFAPDFKAGENAIIPMEFKVYGTQMTVGSVTDFYLFHHYIVPA